MKVVLCQGKGTPCTWQDHSSKCLDRGFAFGYGRPMKFLLLLVFFCLSPLMVVPSAGCTPSNDNAGAIDANAVGVLQGSGALRQEQFYNSVFFQVVLDD